MIAAVLKFSPQQTQVVLEKETQRHTIVSFHFFILVNEFLELLNIFKIFWGVTRGVKVFSKVRIHLSTFFQFFLLKILETS